MAEQNPQKRRKLHGHFKPPQIGTFHAAADIYAGQAKFSTKIYNLYSTASVSGDYVYWKNGTVSLHEASVWTASGTIHMGYDDGPAILNIHDTAQLNGTTVKLGVVHEGVVNQDGGTLNASSQLSLEHLGSVYNLSTGTVSVADLALSAGNGTFNFTAGSVGALTVDTSGVAFSAAGEFAGYIGDGLITIDGSTATPANFSIDDSMPGVSILTLSGVAFPTTSTAWTGAVGTELTDAGNWSHGLPSNALPGTASGTSSVTYSEPGSLSFKTLTFNDSSTLFGGAANWADGTNTFNDSSVWTASGDVAMGTSNAPAVLNLNGSAQFNGTTLRVGSVFAGVVSQLGGSVSLSGQLSLENSGSAYQLSDGSVEAGDLALSSGNGNINFSTGDAAPSLSVGTNGSAFVAAGGFDGYINNGLITLDGDAVAPSEFAVNTNGSGQAVLTIAPPPVIEAAAGVPNLIIFLADDMGQGDTSAYQDWTGIADTSQVYTPTMELLAQRGVRFTDAHSASGVCQPSRIALTRGGRPERNQANFGPYALPKMLKKAGFMTYGIGKWHIHYQNTPSDPMDADLGSDYHYNSPATHGPLDYGYDHYTGTENNISHSPAFIVDRHYMKYDTSTNGLAALVPNMSTIPPGYGTPEGPREEKCQQVWVDAARNYMADHAVGGSHTNQPFFLYYASHANHKNYFATPAIDGIAVTGNCHVASGQLLSIAEFGLEKQTGTGGVSTYLNNGLILERSEMVWENDVALSRLINWLENADDPRNPGHKMIDNTLLIFTADNGANIDRYPADSNSPTAADSIYPHPNHGKLRGRKGDIWEGGNRIPFIASWPGKIPSNTTSSAQISLLDLYATFASIASVPLEANEALYSFSMLDAMLNPAITNDRPQGVYASDKIDRNENFLRDGGYKIIWYGSGVPVADDFKELYNLDVDLGEATNLLGNAAYAGIEASLKAKVNTLTTTGRARPTMIPEVWLAANTTLVGENAAWLVDGDGDGHYNLEEFAMGSAPDSDGSLPDGFKIDPADTNRSPVISFKRRIDYHTFGLTYELEKTGDIVDSAWSTDGFVEVGTPVPTSDGLTEWVSMSYTNPAASNLFVRVRIDVP